jgi:flagellar hook-associated protein 2
MSVTIGGEFSGLNVSSIIQAVIAADSIPMQNLETEDTNLQKKSTDLGDLGTSLGSLSNALQALGSNSLFTSQTVTPSNTTVGTAASDGTATNGSFSLDVTQLATSSVLTSGNGTTRLTAPPAASESLETALGETDIDGQTFTVNGQTITLSSTDAISDVVNAINSSGAGVTASYDATTGNFTIASNNGTSPVILGSAGDTSDFLQQAGLFTSSTGSVTSTTGLGRLNATVSLDQAGLATAPTTGTFTVNGVTITYNQGDSLNTLISNINNSGAGVTAIYDSYDDQMVLTSSTRGAQDITVANGTSNIATALNLASGSSTLSLGQPTEFTVNGSSQVRQSDSNVIDPGTLGVPGVTFTATSTGTTEVTVAPDVTTIANAINAFVTQYNSTQEEIASLTSVNTADTADSGPLSTDTNLTFLAPQLRSVTSGSMSSTAVIRMLSDLGVETNANDDTLTQVNTTDLQNALTNNLSQVEALFNDPTAGLTTTVQNVINGYNNQLNGVIVNEQNDISQQITYNKNLITQMQANLSAEQTQLENEFSTLDQVEAQADGVSSILNGSSSSGSSSSLGSVGGTSSSSSSSTASTNSSNSTNSSTNSGSYSGNY